MDSPQTLDDLKPAPYNPRQISSEALGALGVSLEKFGDISGFVWNKRSGNLVCGHQRLTALKEKHGPALSIQGGAICISGGEVFLIRVVDWDDATEKAANIAANSELLTGEFTAGVTPLLDEIEQLAPDLMQPLRLDEITPSDNVDQFLPNGEPEFQPGIVTSGEIEKQAAAMANRLAKTRELQPMICPKCGHEFFIESV